MKILSESELDARLAQLFKQTAMEIALEELLIELVPADNPGWSEWDEDEGIEPVKVAVPANTEFARFPWLKQISSVLRTPDEWGAITKRIFKVGEVNISPKLQGAYAYASSGNDHPPPKLPSLEWWQGDLHLKLRCGETPDTPDGVHEFTLHVDGDLDTELVRLCWISEDALNGDLNAPLLDDLKEFPVERIDQKTYRVKMEFKDFRNRIGTIKIAEKAANTEGAALRLLPFVEMK